jgi:hypothetical protein
VVFVITRAKLTEGIAIAEEYAFFVRDLVPATGALFTGTVKRLSTSGSFIDTLGRQA